MENQKYAGSEWVKKSLGLENMSPLGEATADILGDLFAGIYHLDTKMLRKVDWSNKYFTVVTLDHKRLSTVDFDELTALVVLAHDRMLRVSVSARATGKLEVMFHQRETRVGDISVRCPTMEDHAAQIRARYL